MMKQPQIKPDFRIGLSMLTETVYAGFVRGHEFIGKKTDVTQSFFATMLDWLGRDEDGVRRLTLGDESWDITIERIKPTRNKKKEAR